MPLFVPPDVEDAVHPQFRVGREHPKDAPVSEVRLISPPAGPRGCLHHTPEGSNDNVSQSLLSGEGLPGRAAVRGEGLPRRRRCRPNTTIISTQRKMLLLPNPLGGNVSQVKPPSLLWASLRPSEATHGCHSRSTNWR
jgi:hypothetical protein